MAKIVLISSSTPAEEPDIELQAFLCEVALRLALPRMSDLDDTWEIANAVCDRYGIARVA